MAKTRLIRCEICFKIFTDMKQYTKHHKKAHRKQLSLFEQITVEFDDQQNIREVYHGRKTT